MNFNTSTLIQNGADLSCIYTNRDQRVCISSYKNNHWLTPKPLTDSTISHYSAGLMGDSPFVGVKEADEFYFYRQQGEQWRNSRMHTQDDIDYFEFIPNSGGLHIIYTVPLKGLPAIRELRKSEIDSNGKWIQPVTIDTVINAPLPFKVQKIASGHYIVFYQTRGQECALGYRELSLTTGKMGQFREIVTTQYELEWFSCLTTPSVIHCCYIVRNAYNCQLVYRKKSGPDCSDPIVLFESSQIDNCVLWILENQVWVCYAIGGNIYSCISHDGGERFSGATRFRGSAMARLAHATLLCSGAQDESKLFAQDLYCNAEMPWQFLVIPDIYPAFYPYGTQIAKAPAVKRPSQNEPKAAPESGDYYAMLNAEVNIEDFGVDPASLRNVKSAKADPTVIKMRRQIQSLNNQIKERDQLINSQTEVWERKENEMSMSNKKLSATLQQYQQEIAQLRNQYEQVLGQYHTANESLRSLRQRLTHNPKDQPLLTLDNEEQEF